MYCVCWYKLIYLIQWYYLKNNNSCLIIAIVSQPYLRCRNTISTFTRSSKRNNNLEISLPIYICLLYLFLENCWGQKTRIWIQARQFLHTVSSSLKCIFSFNCSPCIKRSFDFVEKFMPFTLDYLWFLTSLADNQHKANFSCLQLTLLNVILRNISSNKNTFLCPLLGYSLWLDFNLDISIFLNN